MCAPATSRCGSLNTPAMPILKVSTPCAPATSRCGSLNGLLTGEAAADGPVRTGDEPVRESQRDRQGHGSRARGCAHRRRAGAGVSTPPTKATRRGSPSAHRRRAGAGVSTRRPSRRCSSRTACAPATSRCGSLNSFGEWCAEVVADVRTGDEPVRESQRDREFGDVGGDRECAPATSRCGSLNVAAPKRVRPDRVCAPATSRCGSLNHAAPVGSRRHRAVRTGDEPVRESQLGDRSRDGAARGVCAPATSRCGSLNCTDDAQLKVPRPAH